MVDEDRGQDGQLLEAMADPGIVPPLVGVEPGPVTDAQDGGAPPAPIGAAAPDAPTYVYALGRIDPRFPTVGVEKEYRQALGRADTAGQTDREAFRAVLAERENRYLLRTICWVFSIQGIDTYILVPRDPADFDLLAESLRPGPDGSDIDVVIGTLGPMAPPEACGGLMAPVVFFDQIYSFDRDALVKAIPRPREIAAKAFTSASEALFSRIMQMTDNAGARSDHRALNYLALRYPAIYSTAAECHGRSLSLTEVDVRTSRLAGSRDIVDVVFSYTHRQTDVTEKHFVRVDVTEKYPFLVSPLGPYYDR